MKQLNKRFNPHNVKKTTKTSIMKRTAYNQANQQDPNDMKNFEDFRLSNRELFSLRGGDGDDDGGNDGDGYEEGFN